MKNLISRREKKEPCAILLIVSMELNNAKYQPYQCLGEPETIKVLKEEGIIRFTNTPLMPTIGKDFDAKITLEETKILFSADCYDNPSEKFELTKKEEKYVYRLKGFDGRDEY